MKKQIARSSVLRERCLLLLLAVLCPFLSIAQPNQATSATVTRSAGGSGTYGPQNINDGVIGPYNTTTYGWIADAVLPNWLEFTWPTAHTVNKAKFYHGDRPLNNMSIQYWDGTDFVTLAPYSRAAGAQESEFIFPTVTTTRLRFANVRNGGYNPNFREIELYEIQFSIDAPTTFPTTVCAGSSHTVPYTTVGAFMAGTSFKVQLSDAFGSFATPTDIGTYTLPAFAAPSSGNITATIPTGTPAAGGYRVRVIHANTNLISPNNGANITVNPSPAATLSTTGNATSCITPDGFINIASLAPTEIYTVNYKRNNTAVTPFDLTADGSGVVKIEGLEGGTYSEITVTNADGCTSAKLGPVVLTSPTPPTAPSVSNNGPICQDGTLQLSTTATGVTYSWSGPNTFSSTVASPSITSATTAASGTYTLTVKDVVSGCTNQATTTATVKPKPTITPISNQTACNGAATTAINMSVSIPGTTLAWTNNNAAIGLGASGTGNIGTFNALNATTAPVVATITVTPTYDGCAGPNATFTYTVNPSPNVNFVANQTVCAPSNTTAVNFGGSVTGTTYTWTNNKPAIGLGASGTGDIAAFATANTTNSPIVATIGITPTANGCTGTTGSFTITVNPKPTVSTLSNQTVCNGATTTTVNPSSPVTGSTFTWANNNVTVGLGAAGSGNISSFTAVNSGTTASTATITVTPSANGCVGTPATYTYTVNPSPTVNTIANQSLCVPASTTAITFGGTVSGTTYAWVNDKTSIGLGASGNGNINAFATANTTAVPVVATIAVTPSANGCTGLAKTFTITANPVATVNAIGNQAVCNGASTVATNFTGTATGTTYAWTNSNTSIGIGASGTGNIPAFTGLNTSGVSTNATITVTPTANGCVGASKTFDYTIKPTPSVSMVANQTICANGSTNAVTFSGLVAGATYTWTNNRTSIGLGASGSGNINAFATANSSSAPVVATISVTPSANGCTGSVGSFTYTVNPVVTFTAATNQTICNGAATTATNFTSTVTGTTYSWTNTNTAIGLAANGTGNVPSFTAVNTTNAPISATITVTPMANGCAGVAKTFTYTVNPTPTVNAVADQTICVPGNTTAVNFSGSVAGTTYAWSNNKTSIGLGGSNIGNIPAFAAVNSGTVPVVATIAVTPSANGCTGVTGSYTYTVNPQVIVNNINNQVICNGASSTAVAFSGIATGTVYNWTNTNSSIGLSGASSGDIAPFVAINTGIAPVTSTITVTPTANGCTGTSKTFTYTVNPTPTVDAVADQNLCVPANSTAVNFTSPVSGTTYTWTNNRTTIGLGNSGAGNIPAFVAVNNTNAPIVATIGITPTANNCVGVPGSFEITVNPTPTVTLGANQAVCNGATTTLVSATSTIVNSSFMWTNSDPSIGLAAIGSGNLPAFNATNTTANPVIATVTVTPSANGCTGNPVTYLYTVNPTPKLSTSLAPAPICDSTVFNYPPASLTAGTMFAWVRDSIGGIANRNGNGIGNPNERLDNTATEPVVVRYKYTLTANGCTNKQNVDVAVNASPKLSSPVITEVCSGTPFSYKPATLSKNTTFAWKRDQVPGIMPANSNGNGNIAETLTNGTNKAITVTYVYTLTANNCSASEPLRVRVDALPAMPVISIAPPQENVAKGAMYLNFGVSTPASSDLAYAWTADRAVVWAQSKTRQNALVNFPNADSSKVTVTATIPSTGCESKTTYAVKVENKQIPNIEVVYANGSFVCLQSNLNYKWGYDDIATLDSTIIANETNQNYHLRNPDFDNKYYWVMTTPRNGDKWIQKTYLRKPTTVDNRADAVANLNVYPNPASDMVNVSFDRKDGEEYQLTLSDMSGKTIKTVPVSYKQTTIDIREIPAGVYMISCYSNGVRIVSSRFVKN